MTTTIHAEYSRLMNQQEAVDYCGVSREVFVQHIRPILVKIGGERALPGRNGAIYHRSVLDQAVDEFYEGLEKCHQESGLPVLSFEDWFAAYASSVIVTDEHIIENATRYKRQSVPHEVGLYFIVNDNRIDYVGRSVAIDERLHIHAITDRFLRMDRVFTITDIPASYLTYIEAYYIHRIDPPENRAKPSLHQATAAFL